MCLNALLVLNIGERAVVESLPVRSHDCHLITPG